MSQSTLIELTELNKEFYELMGWKYPASPVIMPVVRRAQFMAYIISEVMEFGNAPTIWQQADALGDALYFIIDAFLEMGINPDVIYRLIHEANMTKKHPDGARFNYDVIPPKLIKPESWTPPEEGIREYLHYKIMQDMKGES